MINRPILGALSRALLHPWFRLRRGLTLGVRAAIFDHDGRVMLVRHTYAPGWLLPGGGVERGETVYDAVKREIREETGIVVNGVPELHGVFANDDNFPGDHIACFVIREFAREARTPSIEIAEARFFPATDLPKGTTGGT